MSIFILLLKGMFFIFKIVVFILIPGFSLRGNPWLIIPAFIIALIYFILTIESTTREYEVIKNDLIKQYHSISDTKLSTIKTKDWNPKIYSGDRNYNILSNQNIKDNNTNLVWQNRGSSNSMSWDDAKKYCEELYFRLPTIKELSYLVDRNRDNPAVDKNYFNLKTNSYWSSTPLKRDNSYCWTVTFKNGLEGWNLKKGNAYVICVK